MFKPQNKTAFLLSLVIAFLAAFASAGGLILDNLYRDNAFVTTTWLGNDIITLAVAVPVLLGSLYYARRGSVTAGLVWLGMLDYMLYNYAFYLFAAAFNQMFLVYAAVAALSILALIFSLANLDTNQIKITVLDKMPVRWIAGYFLFVALGLTSVYVIQSVDFITRGILPSIIPTSGHPTSVVFALDFTLLIPWLVIGAFWLIKRKPWGFVIAGIINIKGPLYTLILSINTILVNRAGISQKNEIQLWGTLTVLGLIASTLFYSNMRQNTASESRGKARKSRK